MKPNTRIAILHDSDGFGGHEIAFLRVVPAILDDDRIETVIFYIYAGNSALLKALSAINHSKLHITTHSYRKLPGETFIAPFRISYGLAARRFVSEAHADIVLMLQGRVENLATPMIWLPKSVDIVSYLPMAHSGIEMGRHPLASFIRDSVKQPYYARPQRTIVVSTAVAAQLRRAGRRKPVYVVENVPPPAPAEPVDRAQARQILGLPPEGNIALFMGRFDMFQKGLDRLIRDIRGGAHALDQWLFIFVGGGPAESALQALLNESGIDGRIVNWSSRPDRFMAACDVLLLPSRFEGVPLIMLEAMCAGLPVLASKIDVYEEYLSLDALYDFEHPVDLPGALEMAVSPRAVADFKAHADQVLSRLKLETSQQGFLSALLGE